MTRKIILALALAAAVAAVAVPSFAAFHSHKEDIHGSGTVCTGCNGTGRSYGPQGKGTGNYQCSWCKGTGWNSGY